MILSVYETAAQDASWFAIRHPAVLRLLERELATDDGDAFAAGLELACRVLGGRTPPGDLRVPPNTPPPGRGGGATRCAPAGCWAGGRRSATCGSTTTPSTRAWWRSAAVAATGR